MVYLCCVDKVYRKRLIVFLIICLFLLFVQVMIGGITRLTGSGLSITKWEVLTGTIPPLNIEAWNGEFDLYKASPQYQKLNEGMSLSEFKFIYFWEWLHRFWGRLVFMAVLGFFAISLIRKKLSPLWIRRFLVFLFLYACQGFMGWFMVMSGLSDMPYVSHFRLAAHLVFAMFLFAYIIWMLVQLSVEREHWLIKSNKRGLSWFLVGLLLLQVVYGAFMSGLRAAIEFPSWPKMNGQWVPDNLFLSQTSFWQDMLNHKATIQFIHRGLAYFICLFVIYYLIKMKDVKAGPLFALGKISLPILLVIQVALGVTVLILSKQGIPVSWGVIHQLVGLLLLSDAILLACHFRNYLPEEE